MINFKITTPERTVYEDEVKQVSLMTETGEITIMTGHISLVSNLRAGEIRLVEKDGTEQFLAASTGFVEVRDGNKVIVLADTAERAEELDLEKIEEAKRLAEKVLEEKRDAADVAFTDAAVAIERELARIKVARKRKYRDLPQTRINK